MSAYTALRAEVARAEEEWGDGWNLADGTGPWNRSVADEARAVCDSKTIAGTVQWRDVLLEEVWEAMAEADPARLRAELLQVAAVAIRWVQAIDARGEQ